MASRQASRTRLFPLPRADSQDVLLRQGVGEKAGASDPLFHSLIPMAEGEFPIQDRLGEIRRGFGRRIRVTVLGFDDQIPKDLLAADDHAPLRLVEKVGGTLPEIVRKHFPQPLSSIWVASERTTLASPPRPSISSISAATISRPFCATLDRASWPRRPWTTSQSRVPPLRLRATWSAKPASTHRAIASSFAAPRVGGQTLGAGDLEKLLEELLDLPSGFGMDGERSQGVDPKVMPLGVGESPDKDQEVRNALPENFRAFILDAPLGRWRRLRDFVRRAR